jgi:hypothetical protein
MKEEKEGGFGEENENFHIYFITYNIYPLCVYCVYFVCALEGGCF